MPSIPMFLWCGIKNVWCGHKLRPNQAHPLCLKYFLGRTLMIIDFNRQLARHHPWPRKLYHEFHFKLRLKHLFVVVKTGFPWCSLAVGWSCSCSRQWLSMVSIKGVWSKFLCAIILSKHHPNGNPGSATVFLACCKDSEKSCTNCNQICENTACCENAQVMQCTFLVPQVENCLSLVFVIFMSKNLSTNLCRRLWRVNVSYQGEISLHFDLPSLYSCRTWNPLLRALIRIPARRLSRHS